MTFSILIVSYNTRQLLQACLSSIRADGAGVEMIVIDNASSDASAAMVERDFPAVRLVQNQANLGFGAACNAAAALASGDIILFLNSDAQLPEGFLGQLGKAFQDRPDIVLAAPLLRDAAGAAERQSYGRFPTIRRSILRQIAPMAAPSGHEPFAVDWLSGAALAIRRSAFSRLGGFDEKFFMYFEDVDLCYRAKEQGMGVFVLPALTVLHHRGASLSDSGRRRRYYRASQRYFFQKHYGRLAAGLIGFLGHFR